MRLPSFESNASIGSLVELACLAEQHQRLLDVFRAPGERDADEQPEQG